MSLITEHLTQIRTRISTLAAQSGRPENSVRLLAVSKTFPASDIAEAIAAGQVSFGENRVQELAEKVPVLPSSVDWHLIGQLQSNKAVKAVLLANWIHSVDSLHLLEKIGRAASVNQKKINILLEVNSGEENKSGFRSVDDLKQTLERGLSMEYVEIKGLMTMAPMDAQDAELHRVFADLRNLRDRLQAQFEVKLPELSMGMSRDYPQAIAEGATMVRIGTAIFGGRTYSA